MIATSTTQEQRCDGERGNDEAEEADRDAGDDAGDPLPAHRARHHLSEEDMADEVDDRAGDDRDELRCVQRLGRMRRSRSRRPTADTMMPATRTTWRNV